MNPALVEAFRVPPRRATIPDLHGPGGPPTAPTERWEQGQLVSVASMERHDALRLRWGRARCEGALVAPVAPVELSAEDLHRSARPPAGTSILRRAFRHLGCKAAQIGGLEALDDLGDADLARALTAARTRPRDAVLAELLGASDEPTVHWVARIDALDRELDRRAGGESWAMQQVPNHCLDLGPLRNLLRAADRRGVVFRPMRFSDFEHEDRFVPELPVVCLDADIYGGGFDHDLFHACVPTLAAADPLAFEAGMLAVEAAGQAFNSAVLAGRHSGPAYDGWATWPGAPLFDELRAATGLDSLPQQVRSYASLGLVGHPDFPAADAVETFASLLGPAAVPDRARLGSLIAANARYLARDAAWLRGLWPRYATPVFDAWRPALRDRVVHEPAQLLGGLDALLDELEDIDLRTLDHPLVGATTRLREDARHLALKALELDLLLGREGAHGGRATLAPGLAAALDLLDDLGEALVVADVLTRQPAGEAREPREAACEAELARLRARVQSVRRAVADGAASALALQRAGAIGGPRLGDGFLDSHVELFDGVFYTPPVHVGADWPWSR